MTVPIRPTTQQAELSQLSPSVALLQGKIWQCNCIIIRRDDSVLFGDGTWSDRDAQRIAEEVSGSDSHLLITHGDIDHCSCIGACTHSKVVGSPATAERIRSGSAGHDLEVEAAKWGMKFPGEPRIDMVVEPGSTVQLGAWKLHTIEAAGHAGDGMAYVIEEDGVFLVGDYLMASQHPMIWWSIKHGRETTERLLQAIETHDLQWIVPGHGPALTPREASKIGEEDLQYLRAIEEVAVVAKNERWSKREWHLAIESVPAPRPCAPDIEMLCPRLINAASAFRDQDVNGNLPWVMDMA